MQLAAVLDTFIQSHTRYWQAQEELHMASKRFVEADNERQIQLVVLEKLLLVLKEEMGRVSHSYSIARPAENFFMEPLSPQPLLPSANFNSDSGVLPGLYFICFGRFDVNFEITLLIFW